MIGPPHTYGLISGQLLEGVEKAKAVPVVKACQRLINDYMQKVSHLAETTPTESKGVEATLSQRAVDGTRPKGLWQHIESTSIHSTFLQKLLS